MKRLIYLAGVVAATISLTNCTKNADNEQVELQTITSLDARIVEPQTKTVLDGLNMKWEDGDKLRVIGDTYEMNVFTEFTLSSGSGTNNATFTATNSGESVTSTTFYAFYPASTTTFPGNNYVYFSIPTVQTYVANGIDSSIKIPMRAYGTNPTDLEFKYGAGILRVNLFDAVSSTPVTITSIEVDTDKPASGTLYCYHKTSLNQFPVGKFSNNTNVVITYNILNGGIQLSADEANPTQFNIVLAASSYNYVSVTIHCSDGTSMIKTKNNATIGGGVIHNFAATQFTNNLAASPVRIRVEGTTTDLDLSEASAMTAITDSSDSDSDGYVTLTVTAPVADGEDAHIVTSSELAVINTLIAQKVGTNSLIKLDCSQVTFTDNKLEGAFTANTKIGWFVCPSSLKTLGKSAFGGNKSLLNITLNEGLTTIALHALYDTGLTDVTLPASLTSIYGMNLIKAKNIYVASGNTKYKSIDGVLYSLDGKTVVMYPGKNPRTEYTIADGVETMAQYSFMNADLLESLTIPATVKKIHGSSFQSMVKLHTINCEAETPPALNYLSYRPTDKTKTSGYYPGNSVDTSIHTKTINVPLGTKAAYESHNISTTGDTGESFGWQQFTFASVGYVFNDGSNPLPASGTTIADLGTNNITNNWK